MLKAGGPEKRLKMINYPAYFRETAKYYRRKKLRDDFELAANIIEKQRTAIERALADEESGEGWGPDNTICEYLREAIE